MKMSSVFVRRLLPASVVGIALTAVAAVQEQVVGSAGAVMQTVVSRRGGHVAFVAHKGSRVAVVVDGTAGPKFDAIVTPSTPWVDPRPFVNNSYALASGRHSVDQLSAQPVVFSEDGSHFAYLGKLGQEWVLMEDQTEVIRLPESAGREIRLQFAGETGKHLLFAVSAYEGFGLWVDGKRWPGSYLTQGSGVESTEPIVSPDGEHIAYPAQIDRNKRAFVLDGHELPYYAEKPQFTADSKHLVVEAPTPKGVAVLLDGKPAFTARQIIALYLAPTGVHIAAVLSHEYPDHSAGQFVLLDNKPIEATLCKNGISSFVFSPDAKHYAAICSNAAGNAFVVYDGKKGQDYDMIGMANPMAPNSLPYFSSDSSKLVYLAHASNKYFAVINGEEADDAFDNAIGFQFSPDGKRLAYAGMQTGQQKALLVIDGKAVRLDRSTDMNQFVFSPDSTRWSFVGAGPNNSGTVYLDGQATPMAGGDLIFSPDSKHVAIAGYNATAGVQGLWLDGELVYKGERYPSSVAFSNDSQHIYWMVPEGSKTVPGTYEIVTYADGKPVARADNTNTSYQLVKPIGYSDFTVHPGWQPVGDSSLVCLGQTGDDLKRYTLTAEGSVATVISDAHAAAEAEAAAIKARKKR